MLLWQSRGLIIPDTPDAAVRSESINIVSNFSFINEFAIYLINNPSISTNIAVAMFTLILAIAT